MKPDERTEAERLLDSASRWNLAGFACSAVLLAATMLLVLGWIGPWLAGSLGLATFVGHGIASRRRADAMARSRLLIFPGGRS